MAKRKTYTSGAQYRAVMARKAELGDKGIAKLRERNRAMYGEWQERIDAALRKQAAEYGQKP